MTNTRSAELIMERSKAYQEIKGRLRQRLGRQWEPGVRLPPIKHLAQQLSTGQTNTHRAVKELVKEGYLVSRPGRGTFVTHKLADMARWTDGMIDGGDATADDAETLSGVIVDVLAWARAPDNLFTLIIERFAEALKQRGADVHLITLDYGRDLDHARHAKADAVVVMNPNFRQHLTVRPGQALSVISTGNDLTLPLAEGYDIVGVDSEQGGLLAGRHLREAGSERPCFIGCVPGGGTAFDMTSTMRLRGFQEGYGDAVSPRRIFKLPAYMSSEGAKAVTTFLNLDPRPDAVFAASDELANGFIHGALAHGLEPGRDYQIVGFDGQHKMRHLVSGAVTSIAIPDRDMPRIAAALLAQRILDPDLAPRRVALGCKLAQGDTTRRASPHAT